MKINKIFKKQNVAIFCLFFLMFMVSTMLIVVPNYAIAADFPGSEEQLIESGNKAITNMNIKIDDEQLSFTAPSVINFAMRGDGTFITPNDDVAYIKNNSLMAIKVKKFEILSDPAAKGVVDLSSAKDSNAYFVNIKPNANGTVRPFSVSSGEQGTDILGNDWIMKKSGTTGQDTLGLRFSDGKMINIADDIWSGPTGHALQKVTWTVSANLS